MTAVKAAGSDRDDHVGAVESFEACRGGDQCPHCKAGRPAVPVEVGDPRDGGDSLWELDDAVRWALPPAYHRPVWLDTCTPKGWFCACCWDESQLSQWPCVVAARHGDYLGRSLRFEYDRAKRLGHVLVAGVHDKLG